ncbi:hypothetical protein VNI00_016641 [Paramarasmius palmivorus]|uniref:BTB domain-containing protein n=1 Tax=Paramarasmius palmivorus TaxID=297713 RepID=A0AAW0BCD7_9AGAR
MDETPMVDVTNTLFGRQLPSVPTLPTSTASYGRYHAVLDAGHLEALAVSASQPPPRFYYRNGREWEFQILVNGEDCDYEVPASLLSVVSRYFSGIARAATRTQDGHFDYVQVNVVRYNRDVVGTVLGEFTGLGRWWLMFNEDGFPVTAAELVYRLDDPSSVLNRFIAISRTGDDFVRGGVCYHLMDVLRLANEWAISRLKRCLQDALVRDFDVIVSPRDLAFVYDVTKRVKAGILGRECEVAMQRLGIVFE